MLPDEVLQHGLFHHRKFHFRGNWGIALPVGHEKFSNCDIEGKNTARD